MSKQNQKSPQLPFNLLSQVCSVIQETGFVGNAEEYVKQFYGKPFADLTVCEAKMIVRTLGNKPGCLYEGNSEDLKPTLEVEDGTE